MGVKIRRFDLRSKQPSRTSSFMQARSSGLIGQAGCTKGRQRGRTTTAGRGGYGGEITDAVAAAARMRFQQRQASPAVVAERPGCGRQVQDVTAAASQRRVAQRGTRGLHGGPARAPV